MRQCHISQGKECLATGNSRHLLDALKYNYDQTFVDGDRCRNFCALVATGERVAVKLAVPAGAALAGAILQ